ncbi:MAG TPA: transglycosylase SLT domain-containing protein [Casimicrobiaceae bacterium]|nr:transglycosylase SLT domain-containing protein [Casimicrobiaceae bacterium]
MPSNRRADLTRAGAGPYHPPVLRDQRPIFADGVAVAIAAFALALASCATGPPVVSSTTLQTATITPPPAVGTDATGVAPASPAASARPAPPAPSDDELGSPEEPITAAEIAAEPMPIVLPPEPPPQIATGGDPDSVTNATLQLRSEYGDLWSRIRQGFVLEDLDGPLVKSAEDWYAARPDYVARMVERSRRYLYYIVVEVEKRGMPLEIALLPMIESAYNPMAYSRSRASGIWQFIPSTGKRYGMEQNWWFDERRDVVAATEGALDYLQALYADFGDWYLALAAYNWGEGAVHRAISANQKRGKPTDYLSLKMPAETRGYVPKLQAVKNIVNDPERYALSLADIPDAPYFTVVHTSRKMDVKAAADLAEMPLDEFLSLNPQHNRPVIAGADEATLLLPYDKAELFAAKLELTNQPMVTWQAYKLKANETLPQVAARFGLSLETLRTVNGIGPRAKVPVGHALLVPSQAPSDATVASLQNTMFTSVPSGRTIYHRVRKGETLSSIAARYDVSTQDIKGWNKGLTANVVPGQRLRVVSDAGPVRSKKSKRGATHAARTAPATVRPGVKRASAPSPARPSAR